ncbi:T9SS type A sorting domain-containing protein [bacterium]|nr:T9SS type A sorting domain-containing protein [bacterium]
MIKTASNHDVYALNADDPNAFGNVHLYKLNTDPSGYGKVSGTITTVTGGLPVEHASIVVVGGSDSCIVNNVDGTYTMYLSPGTYSLKAQSAGVNQIIGSVNIVATGNTVVDFQLPLSGTLGSIGVSVSNIYQDDLDYIALLYGRYGNGAPFPVDTLSGNAFTNLSSLNFYDSIVVVPSTVPYITTSVSPLALNNDYTINVKRADVLIINDPDPNFGVGGATYAPTYQTPLSDSGFSSFNWNVDERGRSISLSAINKTNLKTVMWLTRRHLSSMPQEFLDSLAMFCNEGIDIIVAGQNLVELDSAHSFFKNTLKLGFTGNYTNSTAINGFTSSPIGNGINFSASSSTSRDKINLLSASGHKAFYYGSVAGDSVNIGGAFVDNTGSNGWALLLGFDLSGVASSVIGKIFKRTLSLNAPIAPSNLMTTTISASKIQLSWTDNADNETGFIISRSLTSGSGYANIDTVEANETTLTDSNLTASTTYYYVVKAVNASGTSANSNEANSTTFALPLGEQYAPHIATSILQNPALSKYFDMVVVTDTVLSGVPTVKMWVTGLTDTTSIAMAQVNGTNKVYRGASVFSVSGTYNFRIKATTSGGRDSIQTRTYGVTLAKPGQIASVTTPNGQGTLQMSKHSVKTETYMTASDESETVVKFGPESDYAEELVLTMTYAQGNFADEGKVFIYQKTGDTWTPLRTQVYAEKHQVRALVKTLGEFKVGLDATFTGNNVVPKEFTLKQNYPNPFNPSTTIAFDLPQDGTLKLVVYNLLGQRVKTLYSGFQLAGSYRISWDGKNELGQQVASGVYLYRVEAGAFVKTKKMMLIK